MNNSSLPFIPETVTVHLGAPNETAKNVTVSFPDYIKNVASSEIYPTWPENAIRANVYAQISFALNRIYTEYYRVRGYPFDITNSTAIDQSFVYGRDIFENVSQIVDDIFNSYIRRQGSIEPLFAQYCDGIEVSCDGLSQWGTVTLAENGLLPYQILQYYYGDDIELVTDAPATDGSPGAPAVPLRLGFANDDVRTVQLRLNRISANFPSIPKIVATDGIFGTDTEAAVRRFQEIFGLTPDGIVGNATWYNIQNVYIGVKRLNDLNSEGITLDEVTKQYPGVLQEGDSGNAVLNLQYFIAYVSQFYDTIPSVAIDGQFGPSTTSAVRDVQRTFGLPTDGVVGEATWNALYRAFRGIVDTIPREYAEGNAIPFGGVPLREGAESEDVRLLQQYLNEIATAFPEIPAVNPTGYFGPRTEESVIAFQELAGITPTGIVGAVTWSAIADLFNQLTLGNGLREGQYPGFSVGA